jgi:hypothetical protein
LSDGEATLTITAGASGAFGGVIFRSAQASILDVQARYTPIIDVRGSFSTAIDIQGTYTTVIDVLGEME